jgi:hypothetical protein
MLSEVPVVEPRGWIVPGGGARKEQNDHQFPQRLVRVSEGDDALNTLLVPAVLRTHPGKPLLAR